MRRIALLLAVLGALAAGCAAPIQKSLVSVRVDGTTSGNAPSYQPVLSPDGTKIAFVSNAGDLGPPDTNNAPDLYVRDLATGVMSLVTIAAHGHDAGNHPTPLPGVWSPDGTKIAFSTEASNLGPTDSPRDPMLFVGDEDVYVRDLVAGTTTLVSVNAAGTDRGDYPSSRPVWSPNGTEIGFTSRASDLGPANPDHLDHGFIRNLVTGTTSPAIPEPTAPNAPTGAPIFSPDGTRYAVLTYASNLGLTDTNGENDIYLVDRSTGSISLASANADGTDSGNAGSYQPAFTPDGGSIVFETSSNNLGPPDVSFLDIYLRDLTTGATQLLSGNAEGTSGGNGHSFTPVLSPDGTKVVWQSEATDLGPTDTNGTSDLYVLDLVTGGKSLVSVNGTATDAGSLSSHNAVFSPDSTRVAFMSYAWDLGPTDSNGHPDIYVRDLVRGRTSLVSSNAQGNDSSNGWSVAPVSYGAGGKLAFVSDASNFGPTDTNNVQDVYVATVP